MPPPIVRNADWLRDRTIIVESGCWEWNRARQDHGYGVFWLKGKLTYAHRAAYELMRGPIPAGMQIDHVCSNPPCINPAHLRLATPSQNSCWRRQRIGASRFRGVWINSRTAGVPTRWAAFIHHHGERVYLGNFPSEIEAARAYNAKAIELHGEFARLNELAKRAAPVCDACGDAPCSMACDAPKAPERCAHCHRWLTSDERADASLAGQCVRCAHTQED